MKPMVDQQTDIHGTDWAEHQRVFKVERDEANPRIAHLHFAVPLEDGQVATLLEYLRTWHP